MNVGIFGGSFDPVHNGHLRVAEVCRRAVPLDEVVFVPAAAQPLKPEGPRASGEDRLRMLELALGGRQGLLISRVEFDRGGISYTVDTLQHLATARPHDRLYLILGADALRDLPQWRQPEEICRLATLLVVERPDAPPPAELLKRPQPAYRGHSEPPDWVQVPLEPLDISSSEIRRRLARGDAIDDLVPPRVAAYIAEHRLYRP